VKTYPILDIHVYFYEKFVGVHQPYNQNTNILFFDYIFFIFHCNRCFADIKNDSKFVFFGIMYLIAFFL
jgi:hypothetical protein